jgi:CubicO group peptidase (beta-lactamase class C family)
MILRRRVVRLICALLCSSAVFPALARNAPPADLDAYVARSLKTYGVPGIAIAIVKDGKVVLQKGYGVRKAGEPAAVDAHTLFGIGSTSKAFTAAALATLVDAGKLTWDDPVYERLKGFEMYDPYVSKEMRIRDLLCHRSGLGLGEGDLMLWPRNTYTRDDIVYRLRFLKPVSTFRSQFAYNNLMFIAAGQVVAEVSGQSWDDYLRDKIFTPLGMKDTNTTAAAYRASGNRAFPHHGNVDGKPPQVVPFVDLDNAGPAGSINSSVADMSQWLLLQLNHGKIPGTDTRVFSEKSSKDMWTQQSIYPVDAGGLDALEALRPRFYGYGMGWFLRDYKGRKLVGHPGGVGGFVTRVMLVPEENLGVVILTNADEVYAYESILYHILDGYLGGPTEDYITGFKAVEDKEHKDAEAKMQQARQARAADSKPSLALERYAGDYSDPWFGKVIISAEGGGLVLKLPLTNNISADLQHWQYDTFKAHWRDGATEDAFVAFALRADGSIDHFTMAAVSPLADFSADYQDLYFTPVAAAAAPAAAAEKK